LGFDTASDPLLAVAVRIGAGALAFSVLLLAAILALRLRLRVRAAREARFAGRWQPVIAAWAAGAEDAPPFLPSEEGLLFLALWLRAQESMRGEAQERLNRLAAAAGADRMAVGYLASGDARREMLALVAAGHLRLLGIWPLAEALAAQAPPAISLAAAQALLRIDARRALARVLALAAGREDWPVGRVGAMLRECDVNLVGPALAAAIEAEQEAAPKGPGLARLLHLLGPVAAEQARPVVRAVLAGSDRAEVHAAALDTLWSPEDADAARAHLVHADWFVRLAATKALGRIGGAADQDALVAMLSDANWWVRYRAAQALARLPGVSREVLAGLRAGAQDRYAGDMLGQVLSELEAA
jgi:HEAT repeat protein